MELSQKKGLSRLPLSLKLLKKKLEKQQATVFFPYEIDITFDSLYGLDQEKEIMQDIITYLSSDNKNRIKPHFSYCIYGELGVGKASLVYATSKAANIPVIAIDSSVILSQAPKKLGSILDTIYKTAKEMKKIFGGCSVVFKNVQEFFEMENDSIFFSNLIKNVSGLEDVFSFMLSIVGPIDVPAAVVENNLFVTDIYIDVPNLATREKIFEDLIQKFEVTIADDVSISRLAKDTFGETPLGISYIIKEACLFSQRRKHNVVTANEFSETNNVVTANDFFETNNVVTADDFSETIMKLAAGEKREKMTDKEKLSTAYHEAGHVIAGYFSTPNYQLKRVEISPRASSLGLTATDIDEKKFSYFKEDFENLIVEYLGGLAAEEVIYGSHSSGVLADRAYATTAAANMVKAFGMCDVIGPMQVIPDVTNSEATKAMADAQIAEILKKMKKKSINVVSKHIPYLEALAKALVEKEVILGNEIEEIFTKVKKSLSNENDGQTT